MVKLVLLRHGESTWNKKNLFTGWTDVNLTAKGVSEAKNAGRVMKQKGFTFDIVFTNLHKRATRTTQLVLKEMKLKAPVKKSWRLNERHYGALQGLNKSEMAEKYGEKQVLIWRRSYATRPPSLNKSDKRYKSTCSKYPSIPRKSVPVAESLKDTIARVKPYWNSEIAPSVKKEKKNPRISTTRQTFKFWKGLRLSESVRECISVIPRCAVFTILFMRWLITLLMRRWQDMQNR